MMAQTVDSSSRTRVTVSRLHWSLTYRCGSRPIRETRNDLSGVDPSGRVEDHRTKPVYILNFSLFVAPIPSPTFGTSAHQ